MKLRLNAPCPCHSGKKTKSCCGPVLRGQPAPTPEALMRSRYAAYALGAVGHIVRTTHPNSPHFRSNEAEWHEELEAFCRSTRFDSLTVHSSHSDPPRGEVHFTAGLTHHGEPSPMVERSAFERINGRWLYHSGLPLS